MIESKIFNLILILQVVIYSGCMFFQYSKGIRRNLALGLFWSLGICISALFTVTNVGISSFQGLSNHGFIGIFLGCAGASILSMSLLNIFGPDSLVSKRKIDFKIVLLGAGIGLSLGQNQLAYLFGPFLGIIYLLTTIVLYKNREYYLVFRYCLYATVLFIISNTLCYFQIGEIIQGVLLIASTHFIYQLMNFFLVKGLVYKKLELSGNGAL